ncbi:MAG TPA: lysophospholipid acyltransferase family protein [Actinomycetes bacterium]|nr:lysophospholipid acyltransferase family protein [Actinomycetes bacterium]
MTGRFAIAARLRRLLWRLVLTSSGGLSVQGVLPPGGCVVVANHSSHADTAALLASLPAEARPVFVAAADYWGSNPMRAWACRALGGGYEVRRGGGGSADLAPLVDELRGGRTVVVFPEGTRSRDGSLQRFHSGAFRLAAEAGVPVVPVGLRGTSELLPVHGDVHRAAVQVRIGTPMSMATAADGQVAVQTLTGAPVDEPDSGLRKRVAAFASGGAGLLLVAVWAFLEAMVWPVVPELLLVVLVLAAPAMWWRLTVTALVAGVLGGVVMLGVAGAGVDLPQPLVTDRMRESAAADVGELGAPAVHLQPFSGIPFKVYATAAGESDVDPLAFAAHSSIARGGRFVLVVAVAAIAATAARRWRRYYPLAVAAVVSGFALGLARVVGAWTQV